MKEPSNRAARCVTGLVAIWLSVSAAMAQTATSRIVSAANAFLSTLDQKQRQSVLFAFDDETAAGALVQSCRLRMVRRAASAWGS